MTMNTFKEYEDKARETDLGADLRYYALGLGEAGEIQGKIKKIYRDDDGYCTQERAEAIAYELGDLLWYVARLSEKIGYSLKEVAEMNAQKLSARLEAGTLRGDGDDR